MQKPKKVNVSINPETMDLLTKLRETEALQTEMLIRGLMAYSMILGKLLLSQLSQS